MTTKDDQKNDQKTYHRGQGFGIASVTGFDGPVVVLEANLVTELGRIWHAANARVSAQSDAQGFDAMRNLCSLLAPIFTHYGEAVVEYRAERPLPAEILEVERELEELRKLLEDFDPSNWPGGKGGGKRKA